MVWLPFYHGAQNGGNRFYELTDDGQKEIDLPDVLADTSPAMFDKALEEARKFSPKDNKQAAVSVPGREQFEGKKAHTAWAAARKEIVEKIDLPRIYGSLLTGRKSGKDWYECRDPRSPSQDQNPSAGVADGTGEAERGTFHSFITGESFGIFDFMVNVAGMAPSFGHALRWPQSGPGSTSQPRFTLQFSRMGRNDSRRIRMNCARNSTSGSA